jgi:hypothetical protein
MHYVGLRTVKATLTELSVATHHLSKLQFDTQQLNERLFHICILRQ